MSEPRFTLEKDYDCEGNWEYYYQDNETGRRFNFADDFCERDFLELVNAVINNLKEENKELQGMYDAQRQLYCQLNSDKNNIWQDYQDLKKENEQLKEENQQCGNEIARLQLIINKLKDKDYTNYKKKIQELQDENKKLKEKK